MAKNYSVFMTNEIGHKAVYTYISSDQKTQVKLYINQEYWWIKIRYLRGDPKKNELNMSGHNALILSKILSAIERKTKGLPYRTIESEYR